MIDKVVIFDASERMHISLPLEVIAEINRIRPVGAIQTVSKDFVDKFARGSYNERRGQVNVDSFVNDISTAPVMQKFYKNGKLILLDYDLYGEGLNWCFGGFTPTNVGLGYVILSTAKMQNNGQARDWLRHELGHMFGAPSTSRKNTYESLGLHCSTPLCVMQQKLTVDEAVRYAEQRARANATTYCRDCEKDIKNFNPEK